MINEETAIKAAVGTAAGVATGVANTSAPHLLGRGVGLTNASANFFNGATKAYKNHKGLAGAVSAGTAAVVGHGAVATVAVAAAPVVLATAAIGAAAFGVFKLIQHIQDEW